MVSENIVNDKKIANLQIYLNIEAEKHQCMTGIRIDYTSSSISFLLDKKVATYVAGKSEQTFC